MGIFLNPGNDKFKAVVWSIHVKLTLGKGVNVI